ncbi:MAG TPA: hypothetical protein VFS60_03320 [Thermoanaerobaculia bacterium]|nr:hypothetical protein [Thermoanaerobaculia bacterium]
MVNDLSGVAWRLARFGLALGFALLVGCQTRAGRPRPPQPRELPFATFEPQAPFPEYGRVAATRARTTGLPEMQLRRELGQTAPAPTASERQHIPVGRTMTASLPANDDWLWSTAGGVTIASYGAADGLSGALIYVEAFSPEIRQHPAFEQLRFQATVAPELAEDYLQLATARAFLGRTPQSLARQARLDRARGLALLATRTRGQGLGFSPTRGTFSGWRWVGRNARGVTIRCSRHLGVMTRQRPLPEPVIEAMGLPATPPAALSTPPSSLGVSSATPAPLTTSLPAYAVLGSVTDREEQSGAHFAIFCVREPRCLVYRELAEYLGSIEPVEPATAARVAAAAPLTLTELLERLQLSLASDASAEDPSASR